MSYVIAFAHIALASILLASDPGLAQSAGRVDPADVADQLFRQSQIEEQQRFEDRQRQRLLDQQEQAYDREMCLRVGYRGPDVAQCVRDSAALRRGEQPPGPWSPGMQCSTIDVGDGTIQTFCD
jgi:hypothetical protein